MPSSDPALGRSPGTAAARPAGITAEPRRWLEALLAVLAAVAGMVAVAALGLWLAGADGLPPGGFGPVLAATVLMAFGAPARVEGGAAFVAGAQGGITALPLSVSVTGALLLAWLFLRPLRLHAVVTGRELAGRAGRVAVLWAVAVLLLAWPARHSFTVSTGEQIVDELGDLLGASPTVGFAVDPGPALGYGLLWLAVVLALALAASRRTALPPRWLKAGAAVRPAAHATVWLLLAYVAVAVPAGLVEAAVGGHARQTLAVVALGLPNVAWLALGIGMGASWQGHIEGDLGLPVPQPLSGVLRSNRDVRLDLGLVAQQDGRAWLLLALAAVALLLTGLGMAMHAPPRVRPWQHAVRLAIAMAVAMLLVGLVTTIEAAYGLSLLGVGARGTAHLRPNLLTMVPLGAGWGALAGLLGGLVARRVRRGRPGTAPPAEPGQASTP
ncbi:streptophobe family protein [Kitasatospora sp. NPDC059571]|uniref:streptophobe family protein n=1 Tax=Kitasatospora sp. NPDC059571 TaxID=3346871 RepID=UPI0036A0BA33